MYLEVGLVRVWTCTPGMGAGAVLLLFVNIRSEARAKERVTAGLFLRPHIRSINVNFQVVQHGIRPVSPAYGRLLVTEVRTTVGH
jgi:hypothetical protein